MAGLLLKAMPTNDLTMPFIRWIKEDLHPKIPLQVGETDLSAIPLVKVVYPDGRSGPHILFTECEDPVRHAYATELHRLLQSFPDHISDLKLTIVDNCAQITGTLHGVPEFERL